MRRRALLAASQMTGGGQPDTPSKDEWDYYTIVPEEDCSIYIVPFGGANDSSLSDVRSLPFSYRINGGDWIEVNVSTISDIITYFSAKANDEIQVKCYGINFRQEDYSFDVFRFKAEADGKFKVGGTPMSIIYGDEFKNYNVVPEQRLSRLLSNSMITEILNPETFLPYTELEADAYSNMFAGCSELINAPVLPATTLTRYCYSNMFNNCSKLNYIKMLATDISAEYCLDNWVKGVSPTGTFVKHPEATWDVRGVNGVPNGWTIKFDGEEEDEGSIIQFKIDGWSYTAIEGMTWEQWVNSSYYDPSYGGLDIYIVENTVYVYSDTGDFFLIGQNGSDVIIEGTRYELYGPVPAPEL